MTDKAEPEATGPQLSLPTDPPTVNLSPEQMRDLPTRAPSDSPRPAEPAPTSGAEDWTLEARPFGDYELLGEIARGGMGIVYRARERHSGRLVALKMMLTGAAGDSVDAQRFILEARATGELNHPGIVAIHAWGECDGVSFYTMDYVPGFSLRHLLQEKPLPVTRAVRYLLGIARAVAAAHALGILHRDLKPSNIIIDLADQPRVLDFGLAKRLRSDPQTEQPSQEILDVLPASEGNLPAEECPGSVAAQTTIPGIPGPAAKERCPTAKGMILGTPSYMAPEQARGENEQVGPAADVHALGAIFFEMLTGRPPFLADSVMDTLVRVLEERPPSLRALNPQVPATLEAFCRRCLEKDPAARYSDAGALADDLEQRWQRATQSRRFAQLTLVTGLVTGILLAMQQWVAPDWKALAPWVQRMMAAGGAVVQDAAGILAGSLGLFFLEVVPVLSQLAFLVWLGAWFWYANRLYLYVVWLGIAAMLLAWPVWTGLALPAIWLGPLIAVVALGVAVARWEADRHACRTDAEERDADPYLQKLFAVGCDASPGVANPTRPGVELADIELGKTLYQSDTCLVRRARQKSLERPVLVWQDLGPAVASAASPGVVVHHPSVLTLHAVGTSSEGRYLVTEATAATPLAELLERSGLAAHEAVFVLVRVAHALQAFHDQGAIHGRLRADWILVRGDLEPLLCPCGIPSQVVSERDQDVRALGRLLEEWLPPRPRRWRQRALAPLYRVADTARAGQYLRPKDLARDLERAALAAQVRWRQSIAYAIILALLTLPLLLLGLAHFAAPSPTMSGAESTGLAAVGDFLRQHLFLALAPSALLLGYVHGRGLARRYRWRLRRATHDPFFREGILPAVTQIALVTVLPVIVACYELSRGAQPIGLPVLLLGSTALVGFWFLGICLAMLVTFVEILASSLKPRLSYGLFGSAGLFGTLHDTASGSRDGMRSALRTSNRRPETPS